MIKGQPFVETEEEEKENKSIPTRLNLAAFFSMEVLDLAAAMAVRITVIIVDGSPSSHLVIGVVDGCCALVTICFWTAYNSKGRAVKMIH